MWKKAAVSAVFVTVCLALVLCIQEQTGPQVQCPTPKTSNVKVVIRTKQNETGHWISRVGVKQRMDSSEGGEADHWQVDVEQNTEMCDDEDSVLETVFYLSAPPSTRGKPAKPSIPSSTTVSTPIDWVCPTCPACPTPVPSPTTPQPRPKLPKGYVNYPGVGSYKFHTHATVWLEAKAICEGEGGHLAVINSDMEAAVMESLMNFYPSAHGTSNNVYVYVGAHKIGNQFFTVLGEELSKTGYMRWAVNEPSGGNEFCLSLHRPKAIYNDVPCSFDLAFICEYAKKD